MKFVLLFGPQAVGKMTVGHELEKITELKRRLAHKPSKRDVERSERDLHLTLEKYRLNSEEGEIQRENYIKINNTNMSAGEVAKIIQHRFQL